MPKLNVVVTSTREKRAGLSVANWFAARARQHGAFDVELVDLLAIDLPMLAEPNHPRKRQYQNERTKAWSKVVSDADAFVFVVPEYNYGMPPALLNALDHLYFEWNYKAAGFVSYGGASGGMRSVQMAKLVLTSLKLVPIPEGVHLPSFTKSMNESGEFDPGDTQDKSITAMLDELLRWTGALATLRIPV
jgi:NAD(P)H-dependent FMN reductase